MKTRIDKTGVEVEGGFSQQIELKVGSGFKIHGDGSLRIESEYITRQNIHEFEPFAKERLREMYGSDSFQDVLMAKEVVTYPMPSKEDLKKVLDLIYSYLIKVDQSCGLHIHVSLKKEEDYYKIMSWKFYSYFIKRLKDLNKPDLTNRLKNKFCKELEQDMFYKTIDYQANMTGKNNRRYSPINYCFALHKTVEFRIFDAVTTSEDAMEYVKFVHKVVNTFLRKNNKLKPIRDKCEVSPYVQKPKKKVLETESLSFPGHTTIVMNDPPSLDDADDFYMPPFRSRGEFLLWGAKFFTLEEIKSLRTHPTWKTYVLGDAYHARSWIKSMAVKDIRLHLT